MTDKKKIVLAQFYTPNVSYGPFTSAVNEEYCKKQGYIYNLETNEEKIKVGLELRAPTWYKPKLIREMFDTYEPDYVLFVDADAVVVNDEHRIEDFVEENIDIVATQDYGPSKLNAGILLMRNSPWTKEFLQKWWDICEEFPYYKGGLWHDQTCFGMLIDRMENWADHISIIEPHILNARNQNSTCFIFHAFSFGYIKNRTLDGIYYTKFNIQPPLEDNTLETIGATYGTDKFFGHEYIQKVYNKLLAPIKNDVKLLAEIGVYDGNSLRMWKRYFRDARIVGLDFNPIVVANNIANCEVYLCDQSNVDQLESCKEKIQDADVILDDGTHRMFDQQKTFAMLFKVLKPGGIYILEDLHTSIECKMPEKNWCNWGDPSKTITLDMFENYLQTKKMVSDHMTEEEMEYLNNNIDELTIHAVDKMSITSVIRKKK